jgi:hypothetical protein
MFLVGCWTLVSKSVSKAMGGERALAPGGNPGWSGRELPQLMNSTLQTLIHQVVRPGSVSFLEDRGLAAGLLCRPADDQRSDRRGVGAVSIPDRLERDLELIRRRFMHYARRRLLMAIRLLDQVSHLSEGTELTQGARLDLADALLADPQLLANLYEGLLVAGESEAADNDRPLPAGEVAEHLLDRGSKLLVVYFVGAVIVTVIGESLQQPVAASGEPDAATPLSGKSMDKVVEDRQSRIRAEPGATPTVELL